MKKRLKYIAFCLSVLSMSCAKDEPLPTEEENTSVQIIAIASLQYSNVTTDTTWVSMDIIEETYPEPVTHLDLGDPFQEIKDSIFIDIDMPSWLKVGGELPLPDIHISDPYVLFNTKNDLLYVSEFPFREAFRPYHRPEVSNTYDGLFQKIVIKRKYQQIRYEADVHVSLSDENGSSYVQEGTFVGSKMGQTSIDVEVW